MEGIVEFVDDKLGAHVPFSRNDMDSLIEKVSLASPLKADLYLPRASLK